MVTTQEDKASSQTKIYLRNDTDVLEMSIRFPQVVLENLFFVGYTSHGRVALRIILNYETASISSRFPLIGYPEDEKSAKRKEK